MNNDFAREREFEARIDACFPYDDAARSTALIQEATVISLNATCCVLDEICRPPQSEAVSQERQRELLTEWAASFEHELKEPLLMCATALIGRHRLDWQIAVQVMERVGEFDGQRAALSVAYFAGDCDSTEGDRGLEDAAERIAGTWESKGV